MVRHAVTARPRPESDALVVFGVTGDLAHTQIQVTGIAPLDVYHVVRGQFRGYHDEPGVA